MGKNDAPNPPSDKNGSRFDQTRGYENDENGNLTLFGLPVAGFIEGGQQVNPVTGVKIPIVFYSFPPPRP